MAQGKYTLRDQADIERLTDEDLLAEWTALGEKQQEIKAMLSLFSAEHQRREQTARFEQSLGTLNDDEKRALLQYIEAQPADAEAAVGSVGGN